MDFICKTCDKHFSLQSNLSRHCRTHKQLVVNCICGKSFYRSDNLKRHQLLSRTCRALECTSIIDTSKSDQASNATNSKQIDKFEHVSKEASVETEKDEDDESVSDELTQCSDLSDSSEIIEKSKIDEKPKPQLPKSQKNSEGVSNMLRVKSNRIVNRKVKQSYTSSSEEDDSDSPTPVIRRQKHKLRIHRLSKFRKLMKSKESNLPSCNLVANRSNMFSEYGVDLSDANIKNFIRKLSMKHNLLRFKPCQQNSIRK